MLKTVRALALAAGLFLTLSTTATAGAITVDAGWYGFCIAGPGAPATASCQNEAIGVTDSPVTFTATAPVYFQITDAFLPGDTFFVNINSGALTFTTPTVGPSGADTTNPNTAFNSPDFSHFSQLLNPGLYSIAVNAQDAPYGAGAGYLRVISATTSEVPEPASLALMASGLGAFFLIRRRAHKA